MAFQLPDLPYAKDALAPYMSAETMELHHDKHHAAYVNKANELVAGTHLEGRSLEDVIREAWKTPELGGLFNQAGQHWNHAFYWTSMTPNGGGNIPGRLEAKLREDFGSVDAFKDAFVEAGVTQFGSGWAWLVLENGRLAVKKTPNAENPLVHNQTPLMVCDVWEHAYYVDYRNRRPDFLRAWIDHLVNWEFAAGNFERAR